MHDYLFDVASSQGRGGLGIAALADAAETLGMDREEYSECLAGGAHISTIQASRTEAGGMGVASTPTVFVNGVQMLNAFDEDAIRAEIERITAGS